MIRNQIMPMLRVLGAICVVGLFVWSCDNKRGAAPAKSPCKAGETSDPKTGKCGPKSDAGGEKSATIGNGDDNPSSRASTSTETEPPATGAELPKGDDLLSVPKDGQDCNGDMIPDKCDADGKRIGPAELDPNAPKTELDETGAKTIEQQQNGLRYSQFPQGFGPQDGWDIGGGLTTPGFSSVFSAANGSFGSVRVPVKMWIGKDYKNSRGAVVAFVKFMDPKGASKVRFLYRRKAYDEASVQVDGNGQFAGSLAVDVQVQFDYQSKEGALKCKTAVAQLDGRYLAVDPQSMAPREVFNADAGCGKQ
jgi:hypothetical protein